MDIAQKTADPEKRKGGFTLVEIIVVLVILAILAAILIPAMVGYIDKANKKAVIAECRECVNAAQTLASDAYGTSDTSKIVNDKATAAEIKEVKDLSEVEGTISSIDYSSHKVTKLIYVSKNNITCIYEKGKYTVQSGTSSSALSAIIAAAKKITGTGKYTSGADLIKGLKDSGELTDDSYITAGGSKYAVTADKSSGKDFLLYATTADASAQEYIKRQNTKYIYNYNTDKWYEYVGSGKYDVTGKSSSTVLDDITTDTANWKETDDVAYHK